MTDSPHVHDRGPAGAGQEPSPAIAVQEMLATGAGTPLTTLVTVTNTADAPRAITVAALGLDSGWMPAPVTTPLLAPGESHGVDLTFSPAAGTVSARYPLAITAQARDAAGRPSSAPPALAEATLVVSPRAQLTLTIDPASSTAWRWQRLAVVVTNTGGMPADVRLTPQTTGSLRVRLAQDRITVPGGGSVRVRGRVTLLHPQLIGMRMRHRLRVKATGSEATRWAEAEVAQRPMVPPFWLKLVALVAALAVWVGAGVVLLPKVTDLIGDKQQAVTASVVNGVGGGGGADSGGGGGSSDGGGSDGSATQGGGKGPGKTAAVAGIQLSGTVSSPDPAGVTVTLRPTSLVDQQATDATSVGFDQSLLTSAGKVVPAAYTVPTAATAPSKRTFVTKSDGVWSIPGVRAPGYYLLVFDKPGYTPQSFVIDSSTDDAKKPIDVALQPGDGSLSGTVTSHGRPLGGATVTVDDGTGTITTYTATTGDVGSWSVKDLATPATYVVTASKDGLSTESASVQLDASSSRSVTLGLVPGVATLTGDVTAGGTAVGGATVTVTDGSGVTRTATTETSPQDAREARALPALAPGTEGHYHVPGLPAPGDYTVTVNADGYQPLTAKVHLKKGQGGLTDDLRLTSSTGVVTGTVADTVSGTGLADTGLTLANDDHVYKLTSTSDPVGGFRFDGIAPGTYTLTAERFSYQTATQTVKVAGGQTAKADLGLVYVDSGGLTATGHITGKVLDFNTGSPISSCTAAQPNCVTASTSDPCAFGDTTCGTVNGQPADHQDWSVGFAPSDTYLLPPATDGSGLRPGLHTVRFTAPGYEPAEESVAVPLGGTVQAPAVSLYPAPWIRGTVTTGDGSTPTTSTCVFAVPSGAADPGGCAAAVSSGLCKPLVSGQLPYTGTDAAVATACAVVTTGSPYALQVPVHGTYTIYVRSADANYIEPPAGVLVLPVGGSQNYNAAMDRKPHATLTLEVPSAGGALAPAAEGTVAKLYAGTSATGDPLKTYTVTDGTGSIDIPVLDPGTYTVTATNNDGNANDPEKALSGTETFTAAQNVGTKVLVALTHDLDKFIGRALYKVGGTYLPVPGAQVQMTAPYDYQDGLPLSRTITMTSGAGGCFAGYRGAAKLSATELDNDYQVPIGTTASGGCGTQTSWSEAGDATGTHAHAADVPFVTDSMSTVSITAGAAFEPLTTHDSQLNTAGVNDFVLTPKPIDFGDLDLTLDPGVTSLPANLHFTVTGPGSNGVSVTAENPTADGTVKLDWQDGNDDADQFQVGDYTITATADGYIGSTASLSCRVEGCTLDGDTAVSGNQPWKLVQLGSLKVSAVVAGSTSTPIPGATYTLTSGGTAISTITAGATANDVTFTGLMPTTSAVKSPSSYTLEIHAPGYRPATSATCGAAAITVSPGANLCTVSLQKLGSLKVTVRGKATDSAAPTTLTDPTVTLQKCVSAPPSGASDCTGGDMVVGTTLDNGSVSFAGTASDDDELEDGYYLVTVDATGYQTSSATWTGGGTDVPAGSSTVQRIVQIAGPAVVDLGVTMTLKPVTVDVTIYDQAGILLTTLNADGTPLIDAELLDGSGQPTPLTSVGDTGHFINTDVTAGTYTLQVTGPTFQTQTAVVTVQPATGLTLTLPVARGASRVYGTVTGPVDTGATGDQKLGNVTISMQCATAAQVAASPNGPADYQRPDPSLCTDPIAQGVTATTSNPKPHTGVGSNVALTTTTAASGASQGGYQISTVPNGWYMVTASLPGYGTVTYQYAVDFDYLLASATQLNFQLAWVHHDLTVKLAASSSIDDLSLWTATLVPANTDTANRQADPGVPTVGTPVALGDDGTASFTNYNWGCYDVVISSTDPAHLGTVAAGTNGVAPCSTPTGSHHVGSVSVSKTEGSQDQTAAYSLDEAPVVLTVGTTGTLFHAAPATASVSYTAHGPGGTTGTLPDIARDQPTAYWLPVGQGLTYDFTAQAKTAPAGVTYAYPALFWPARTTTTPVTPADTDNRDASTWAAGSVSLTELTAAVTVTVADDESTADADGTTLTVTSTDGSPLPTDTSVSTNGTGSATLHLPNGTYVVTPSHYGHYTDEGPATVTVNAGTVTGSGSSLAVTSPPSYTLLAVSHDVTINITDADGEDLTGWKATVTPDDDTTDSKYDPRNAGQPLATPTKTLVNGSATFDDVTWGCYTVDFTPPAMHHGLLSVASQTSGSYGGFYCPSLWQVSPERGDADAVVDYTLDEARLTVTATVGNHWHDGPTSVDVTAGGYPLTVKVGDTDGSTVYLPTGSYAVTAPTFTPSGGRWDSTGAGNYDVTDGQTTTAAVSITEHTTPVTVTVTGGGTEKPEITVEGKSGFAFEDSATAARGDGGVASTTFDLPDGTYDFSSSVTGDFAPASAQGVQIGDGLPTTVPMTLTANPHDVTVTLTKPDKSDLADTGACITLTDTATGTSAAYTCQAKVGSPGVFTVQVPNGTYSITATDAAETEWDFPTGSITVAGAGSYAMTLTPTIRTYAVTVEVTDAATGSPLDGATVTLRSAGTVIDSGTSSDGAVTLQAPIGTGYTLSVEATGHVDAAPTQVAVTGAGDLGSVALTPLYSATITVQDSTGAALGGATVTLKSGTKTLASDTTSGDDGSVTLTVPEGTGYTLSVTKSGYVSPTDSTVDVKTDGTELGPIVLTETHAVSVTVADDNGDAVHNATVSVTGDPAPSQATQSTGSTGNNTISWTLPVGVTYTFTVAAPSGYSADDGSTQSVVITGAAQSVPLTLTKDAPTG